MAHENQRPVAAFVISLIAGVEIIIVSFFLALIGGGLTSSTQGGIGAIFGIIGMVWGVLIVFSAVMLYRRSRQHKIWGVMIIIFSVVSIFGAIGGLFVGLILGVIGGILGIIWSSQNKEISEVET